jgi:hypothetical protein
MDLTKELIPNIRSDVFSQRFSYCIVPECNRYNLRPVYTFFKSDRLHVCVRHVQIQHDHVRTKVVYLLNCFSAIRGFSGHNSVRPTIEEELDGFPHRG